MNYFYNEGKDPMPLIVQKFLDHYEFVVPSKKMKDQNINRIMQQRESKDYIALIYYPK